MNIDIDIENPAQVKFLQICRDYELEEDKLSQLTIGYLGGKNAGKSFLVATFGIAHCLRYSGATWLVGQSTIPALKDQGMADYLEVLEEVFLKCSIDDALEKKLLIKKWDKTNRNLSFNNNSRIIFRHLNLQTDPNMNVLTGLKISGFHLEESWDMPLDIFSYCRGINGRKRAVDQQGNVAPLIGILSMNPRARGWLYQLFENKTLGTTPLRPEEEKYFPLIHTTPLDNRKYIDDVTWRTYQNMPSSWKRTYLYGKWPREINSRDVFPLDWISMSYIKARDFKTNLDISLYDVFYKLGIDPGIDSVTTIWVYKCFRELSTGKLYHLAIEKIKEYNLTDNIIAEKIDALMTRYSIKDKHVGIDAAGIQIIKHLKENHNRFVVSIQGAIKNLPNLPAVAPLQFNNLRSLMHWYMRVQFEQGLLLLDIEQDFDLEADLQSIRLEDKDSPKLKVIEKRYIIKELGRSTHNSDSLGYGIICDKVKTDQGIIEVKRINTNRQIKNKITSLWI